MIGAIKAAVGKIFKSTFNIGLIVLLIMLGIFSYQFTEESSWIEDSSQINLHLFYLPTCPYCAEQKPIYEALKSEGIEGVVFYSHDVSSVEGSALFYKMASEAGLETANLRVPTIFVDKKPLVGIRTREEILAAIDERSRGKEGTINKTGAGGAESGYSDFELPFFGMIDLRKYSLPSLAMFLGLIDGFNPCAMWILVYLIGLLVGVEDRKKIWLIVGSFVFASGVLYFLFMTAWINIFLFVGYIKFLTIFIGLAALGQGILNIKEYVTSGGILTCKVENEGMHEKTMGRIDDIIRQPLSLSIFFSIIALAFIVNSVEFLCSSAIPAVFTEILALSDLSLIENYLYIALYIFFYMVDDMIIFGAAALAVESSFMNKYAKYCKVMGGILLAVLGLMMLFSPYLLI